MMDVGSLYKFLFLGLGLGMLHAFDPDHLAAVCGITAGAQNKQDGEAPRKTWRFAMHWSLGHGIALCVIAVAVFMLGAMIPHTLSHYAEQSVAFLLFFIGAHALWSVWKSRNGEVAEAHSGFGWLNRNRSGGAATAVGIVHGLAGSAPLLALVPLMQLQQPALGLVYVILFSLGITVSMIALGTILAQVFQRVSMSNALYQRLLSLCVGGVTLALGVYLFIGS